MKDRLHSLLLVTLAACGGAATVAPTTVAHAPVPTVAPPPRGPTTPPAPSADRFGDTLPVGAVTRYGTNRWRTGYAIYGIAFDDSGQRIVAASEGIQVFAADSGRRTSINDVEEPWNPAKVTEPLADAAASFNTRRVRASATGIVALGGGRFAVMGAGRVEVLDLDRRVTLALTETDVEGGDPIATSADGTLIIFRRDRQTAVVWSPGAGTITELGNHLSLSGVALSPDGRYAYTADGAVVGRWDLFAGKVIYNRVRDSVYHLDYDGDRLVAGSGDRVLILDPRNLHDVGECHVGETVWTVDARADGKVAFATDAQAGICDPTTGNVTKLGSRRSMPYQVQWSPDGSQVAVADEDVIELYPSDPLHGKWVPGAGYGIDGGHTSEISAVAVSASGTVATGDAAGAVSSWDELGGTPEREIRHPDGQRIQALAYAGDTLIVAERDGDVWADDGKKPTWRVAPGGRFPEALAISPDGRTVAVAVSERKSADEDIGTLHGVTELDIATGALLQRIATDQKVMELTWTPGGLWARVEGDRLIELDGDGNVDLAKLTTESIVTSDSSRALSCDNAGSCRWTNLHGGAVVAEQAVLGFRASSVALSAGDKYWAAGSFGGEIAIGRVGDAQPVVRLRHGLRGVRVAFSPDGKYLVSGADDTTALVWSLDQLGVTAPPR